MRRLTAHTILPLVLLALCDSPSWGQQTEVEQVADTSHAGQLPNWERRLLKQFESKLYGVLQDEQAGCIDCHASEGTSALVLSGNTLDDLRLLLDNHYLEADGPDSLLGRVTSDNPDRRMPKDAAPWSAEQVKQLRRFVGSVEKLHRQIGVQADERFPRSLLQPYQGDGESADHNQFISYRQLVGKTRVVFEDDWVRGDRDMFSENVAMFGGADFKTRYNENTEPNASFLSGLEMLARDVATRAYQRRTGPFSQWQEPETDPLDLMHIDQSHRQAISQLFQKILYRSPTESELTQAFDLLRSVRELESEIAIRDSRLVFELTVTDPHTGHRSLRTIEIPVSGDRLQVRQVIVDQRGDDDEHYAGHQLIDRIFSPLVDQLAVRLVSAPDKQNEKIGRKLLGRVTLDPDESAQRVTIYNTHTHRNVSFAGIEIRDSAGSLVKEIPIDSPLVQVEGAWTLDDAKGISSYEDGNRHKGLSSITVPLLVEQRGEFEVVLLWRVSPKNTPHALVQLFAECADNHLCPVESAATSEIGSATFFYDSSDDTAPFRELDGIFQFDDESYVEISNAGTMELVTAGAVELMPVSQDVPAVLIDSQQAEGSQAWSQFDEGRFKAYNVKGKKLHDDNQRKGELSLTYRPSGLPDDSQAEGWQPDESYRVRIYYPGKRDQETQVPVRVVAKSSSPILQIEQPVLAKADALVRLDASASYTVQGSQLQFDWKQVSGPMVDLQDADSAVATFQVPRLSSRQFAWTALCSALIRHPDFLFTRPPSLATASPADRETLQLVKLAQDLVGRPPTSAEVELLTDGQKYSEFVDRYLYSEEFRDFYFHRIRLYLESQGTVEQDEPARLWSYIAFEDRPFQEILTADYTVNENFEQVARPDHHGRTGLLTTKGFIQGKPGLPHYNYAAQVSMLFLGYVYEVPAEIVEQREGVTALGTTDPDSTCYSCHKILTPLAFQRLNWTDDGQYRTEDEEGLEIDASDRGAVAEYPFQGQGLEAFATQAVNKERFIRTIINTHVNFYFGRPLRYREDERSFYLQLWEGAHENDFKIRELIRAIVTSQEYLEGVSTGV